MSTLVTQTIVAPLSISDSDFGIQVNNVLVALGDIMLIDAEYKIVQSSGQSHQLSIMYYPGAGQTYGAIGLVALDGEDIDVIVDAWTLANPTLRPLRMFDTSPEEVRVSISESVLILYSLLPDVARPIIVRNTSAAIPAGATAMVVALGTAGPTSRIYTVRNMGGAAWGTNKEGYATFDPISGEWLGVPSCC